MRTSAAARIISALLGLIVPPIAIGLITTGGMTWYRYAMTLSYDFSPEVIMGPVLLQLLGLVLLAVVVLSGLWSSAGLLATGVYALFSLAVAIFPGLAFGLLDLFGSLLPRESFDSLMYGTPLTITLALFGMGLALFLIRRQRDRPAAGAAIGAAIGSPVVLLIGGWLLAWGVGAGLLYAMRMFSFDPQIGPAVGVFFGSLLLIAGAAAAAWSRWALVLPGAVMLLLAALYLIPDFTMTMYSALPREVADATMMFFVLGAGTAVGVAYLLFTLVVVITRRRAQRGPVPPAGYGMPQPFDGGAAAYLGQQYPGQAYPGQQYPGQAYPGQQYPAQAHPGQQYGAPQHPTAGGHPGQQDPGAQQPPYPPTV